MCSSPHTFSRKDSIENQKESIKVPRKFRYSVSLGLRYVVGEVLFHRAMLIVLGVVALTGALVLDDYGVEIDAGFQRRIGTWQLEYLLGERDSIYPYHNHNRFYGVSYALPLAFLERALGLDDTRDIHLMRHMVTHLFFLIGGFFCYLLAYRMFNSRLLAVLAMLLFLLHPRIYAHSFFNTKDAPFLSMFMICLYLAHRALGDRAIYRFVLLGIGVGILINLRVMGIVLFAIVLGMQVLDLFRPSSINLRMRGLVLMGVFALSSVATLYAVSPYLWGDPLADFANWFNTLSQHPVDVHHLFRGELLLSTDVTAPEHLPVWFSVSTPPAVLVLGVAGMLVVLTRGVFDDGGVFRDVQLRFGLVLVLCFITPIVAVIVLGSNIHYGWRQFYFLYPPFCLLATFGVQWLASSIPVPRLRVLMHGVVGVGTAATVVAMASIHPHQQVYFNFLVDRSTPEHLGSRYDMDYWHISFREGFQHLLDVGDDSALMHVQTYYADSGRFNWEILASPNRERLILDGESYDFYITSYQSWSPSELARSGGMSPLIYSRVIYGSKVLGIAAVNLSLVDDAVASRYIETYRGVASGSPSAISDWDVYMDDGTLVYIKESCETGDLGAPFFLHVAPDDIDDLPDYRRRAGHSTRNFDFEFGMYGVRFDGKCMAAVPLPAEGVSGVRTGQFASGGELWSVAINMRLGGESAYRAEYDFVIQGRPVVSSEFDVYLVRGRLVYIKEPCVASDTDAEFFLHLVALDINDLPPKRIESGFDNLDFVFETRGLMFDGMCVASIGLPDYDIERIRTGQWDPEQQRNLWKEEFNVGAD